MDRPILQEKIKNGFQISFNNNKNSLSLNVNNQFPMVEK